MLLKTSLLFELPVYRLSEKRYFSEYNKHKINSDIGINSFGGMWEYNEIIGFLKFYISGHTQIRVEYCETSQKRKRKTRKKIFICRTGSFCTREISHNVTNEKIIEVLKDCIQHCKNNLKQRYIKTDFFDDTYKYMDWKKLIEKNENE